MKHVLWIALVLLGCGAPAEWEQQLGTTTQGMSAKKFAGWRYDEVQNRRCDMDNPLHDCAFPVAASAVNPWRRLGIYPVESVAVPSGFNLRLSREFATAYFSNTLDNWEWFVTTQGTAADLIIASDENIYNGTPPNATIAVSSISNVQCTNMLGALVEDRSGSAIACKQITVKLDVGAFTSWVNLWATSNAQRTAATDSLLRHFIGLATGLGAHSAGDTPMRQNLSRSQSPIEITSYEKCLANSINFQDLNWPDPWLGIYTNNCS